MDGKIPASLSNSHGTQWAGMTITTILRNKAYTGDFTYKGVTFPDYIPAIVSKDDFKKVQYLLDRNAGSRRGGSPTGNVNSIFNGSGKCICGKPMVCLVMTKKRNNKVFRYEYYVCSASRGGTCKKKTEGCSVKNPNIETDFIMRLRRSHAELIGMNSRHLTPEMPSRICF
jgi:hypothetical protein